MNRVGGVSPPCSRFRRSLKKGAYRPQLKLNRVDANADVPMATADEQIRVSDRVKRLLDRRRREGESYNDALERILTGESERDLLAGFGRWSDEHVDGVRSAREEGKERSRERMRRLENEE